MTKKRKRKKSKKKWIPKNLRKGALTRKAKAAGKSISQYCSQKNLSTRSKRQCNLARTLKKMPKRRRKSKRK